MKTLILKIAYWLQRARTRLSGGFLESKDTKGSPQANDGTTLVRLTIVLIPVERRQTDSVSYRRTLENNEDRL